MHIPRFMFVTGIILVAAGLGIPGSFANADIIAREDFDGGALNLIASSVPTLDGGGGDAFAVGSANTWPQPTGIPFSLVDNSVGAVGTSGAFPGDREGIFGTASNFDNSFLGICDSDEFGDVVATWDFNIAGYQGLGISIDMGSMEGSTFSYSTDTVLRFTASIDGGAEVTVFDIIADASGDGYSYRALDDGFVVVAETNALLATGTNPIEKILADTGLVAGNTILDKAPASGFGAGQLDTFRTLLAGSGGTLRLTLTANLPFEGAAFDNIVISGSAIPEPTAIGLCAILCLAGLGVRRRR